MENFTDSAEQQLKIHDRGMCTPPCVFHSPSTHKMREWPILWRTDRALIERICSHGVGHPDPDQLSKSIHGCDGCCGGSYAT